jgi:hypothetical protein
MAAGQADGMINGLVSTLLYNQDTTQIQVVSFAALQLQISHCFKFSQQKTAG